MAELFTAVDVIWELLHTDLSGEFVTRTSAVTTFDKGFRYRPGKMIDPALYPLAILEEDRTGRPVIERNPNIYVYEAVYTVAVFTLADEAVEDDLIYNPDPGSSGHNINPGVGNLARDIARFVMSRTQHGNRAYKSSPSDPDANWSVISGEIGRIGRPAASDVRPLLLNPFVRGKQVDIHLNVWEAT